MTCFISLPNFSKSLILAFPIPIVCCLYNLSEITPSGSIPSTTKSAYDFNAAVKITI